MEIINNLPIELEQSIAISKYLDDWANLIKKSRMKKLKEERRKKLININAKIK